MLAGTFNQDFYAQFAYLYGRKSFYSELQKTIPYALDNGTIRYSNLWLTNWATSDDNNKQLFANTDIPQAQSSSVVLMLRAFGKPTKLYI